MTTIERTFVYGAIAACGLTGLTVALLYFGPPPIAQAVEPLILIPFVLMWFTGWLFPPELGSGLPILVFYLFLQWFLICAIVIRLCSYAFGLRKHLALRQIEPKQ